MPSIYCVEEQGDVAAPMFALLPTPHHSYKGPELKSLRGWRGLPDGWCEGHANRRLLFMRLIAFTDDDDQGALAKSSVVFAMMEGGETVSLEATKRTVQAGLSHAVSRDRNGN